MVQKEGTLPCTCLIPVLVAVILAAWQTPAHAVPYPGYSTVTGDRKPVIIHPAPDQLRACRRGVGSACNVIGLHYLLAKGRDKHDLDNFRAYPFFKGGCRAMVAESCYRLGLMISGGYRVHHDGHRDEPDHGRAKRYFRQACAADHAESCFLLAWNLQRTDAGSPVRVSSSIKKRRIALYKKACSLGHKYSCDEQARITAPSR
jgi:TPR repeat protein